MIIHKGIEQGSSEWHELRLGKVTASRIKDVLSNGRGAAPSKTRETYMLELITEKLTGAPLSSFTNDAMQWGIETESQARAMYELKNDVDVEEVTFIELDDNIGMSPDGLVGDCGLLEIKCPNSLTQVRRALSGDYHNDYIKQIQMQLWVSEREFCDFVSFDPRIDSHVNFLQCRVFRDEALIGDMIAKTNIFINELQETMNKLTKGI